MTASGAWWLRRGEDSSFIRHEASALFAILPGCSDGGYLSRELLAPDSRARA